MSLYRTVEPADVPVTVAELKDYMRISHGDSDELLRELIDAATRLVEEATWRQVVTATWELRLDTFPPHGHEIALPRPPLASVTSIKYVDDAGILQTLATSEYVVDTQSLPGRVYEAYDQEWPTTRSERDAVRVLYVAGQAVASVPASLKVAVKAVAQTMYDFGGEMSVGQAMELKPTARLLQSLSLRHFGHLI